MNEREDLKALLNWVEIQAKLHVITATELNGSLEEALNSLKRLKEEMFAFTNDLVETSDQYFKRVKEHATFFLPRIRLEPDGHVQGSLWR